MDTLKKDKCNLLEIKKILTKHCSNIDRKLLVWKPKENINGSCYFLALEGTPPKGYGIYSFSAEIRMLCLYDSKGKRFKEYYLENEINFDE